MGRTALMHVRNLRFYQTMQFVLDLLAVSVAWTCTIQMRVLLNPLATQRVSWTYASIWAPSLMMILVLWIIMAWRLRFYRVEGRIRLWNSLVNAAEGALLASCNIVIVTFFSRQLGANVSRSFFMIFAPLVFVSLGLARCVSVFAAMVAERHWPSPVRAALLGDGLHAGRLVDLMNSANVANVIKGLIIPEGHTTDWPFASHADPGNHGPTGRGDQPGTTESHHSFKWLDFPRRAGRMQQGVQAHGGDRQLHGGLCPGAGPSQCGQPIWIATGGVAAAGVQPGSGDRQAGL